MSGYHDLAEAAPELGADASIAKLFDLDVLLGFRSAGIPLVLVEAEPVPGIVAK